MIQFQYDEKTYIKMSMRIAWWIYAIILGVALALFAWIGSMYVSNYVSGENDLVYTLIALVIYLGVLVAVVAVFFVSIRKQLAKSFAMYSANGVVVQAAEITDDELIIHNLSRNSVGKTNRRDITSVKKYKNFFVVITNTKVKWAVPLNEQTQLIYDVLTGASDVAALPTTSNDTHNATASAKEETVEQPNLLQTNALSFEYELTEQQAITMLTKVISVRFRALLVAAIFFAVGTVLFLAITIGNYLLGQGGTVTIWIFTVIFALFTTFGFVIYASKGKSGKTSGSNYFEQQSKDGQCSIRIELYDQGIVVVNESRDTRNYFRFADMERVRLYTDFFFVDFKSKEILPVPLTERTRALYDILNNGINRK